MGGAGEGEEDVLTSFCADVSQVSSIEILGQLDHTLIVCSNNITR